MKYMRSAILLAALVVTLPALAAEYPIGVPMHRLGMEIAAVYLQPVVMEPEGMMRAAAESDIHTDRLTGVRPWFKPFTVEYEFTYAGIGKKGGY